MAKTFTSFSNNNASVVTLNAVNSMTLNTTVTVWPSLIHTAYSVNGKVVDTYGEPSMIRVDGPYTGKVTKLTLRTERARELRAAVSAAEASMDFVEIKQVAALEAMRTRMAAGPVDEDKIDEVFKANPEKLVAVAHDPTYTWAADSKGNIISGLILFANPRMRKGEMSLGVINSTVWQGARYLDLTVSVHMPNGTDQILNKCLTAPVRDGFSELNWKDGMFTSPMAELGGEDKDYRTSFYRFLKCLADGESFIIKSGTYLDRMTNQPNQYVSSKAVQLVARAGMTTEQIVEDRQRIMQNMWKRQQERTVLATANATGSVPQTVKLVAEGGELVGKQLAAPVIIKVDGKEVSVKTGTEIPEGEYEIVRGLRNERVRTVCIGVGGVSPDTAKMWFSNRYSLRTIGAKRPSTADNL